MDRTGMKPALRRGLLVLIALAVLTAVEYAVTLALGRSALPYLIIIALTKAGFIVCYFMHLTQLWHQHQEE